jgi:uncharacterized protein (TIGR03435 family)
MDTSLYRFFRLRVQFTLETVLVLVLALVDPSTAADREFDVASIRPSDLNAFAHPVRLGPSVVDVRASLKELLGIAYNMQGYQITGGPLWIGSQRYDVVAKSDSPASRDQICNMLVQLLKTRFHLEVQRASKPMVVYVLSISRNGPKLKAAKEGTPRDGRGAIQKDSLGVIAHGSTMSLFARYLTGDLGEPVIDNTGLDGNYDFRLKYDEADSTTGQFGSIFTALSSVGLKLESKKMLIPIIVIDRAEYPTPN